MGPIHGVVGPLEAGPTHLQTRISSPASYLDIVALTASAGQYFLPALRHAENIEKMSGKSGLLRARPKAERVLLRIRENPEYERPAGRPAVVTLLRGLYLWNRKPDWQAVFFGGYPHSFSRVWDQYRIMPVPTVARGACYLEGCHECSAFCFSVTAGPIALQFGKQLGTH